MSVLLGVGALTLGGCDGLFDELFESDLAVWNSIAFTTDDGFWEISVGHCVPILEKRNSTMEGDSGGPGYADYYLSTDGELYWAYYIAPEGAGPGFGVTPETGELVADFTFDASSFDDQEFIAFEIEDHDGQVFQIVHWAEPDCSGEGEPPDINEP